MTQYTVLLYYKFIPLSHLESLLAEHKQICRELGLTGRILLSPQGINGTIEGKTKDTKAYQKWMNSHRFFNDITYKESSGDGNSFPKLSIKLREEIVTLGVGDVYTYGPNGKTGSYISAETLHDWITGGEKEFYIVDLRNDYEFEVGRFKNSLMPRGMKNFRDLPKVLHTIEHLKDKTIVTCCTGGIRCEIASGFLIDNGFKDVYQLEDGIVTYMEKYPNDGFDGKLFVFDNRVLMGFNTDSEDHTIIGTCRTCGASSENLVDYYELDENTGKFSDRTYGIICQSCIDAKKVYTDEAYKEYIYPQKKVVKSAV